MSEPGEGTLEKAKNGGGLLFMVVFLVRSQRTGLRSPASSNPRRRARVGTRYGKALDPVSG